MSSKKYEEILKKSADYLNLKIVDKDLRHILFRQCDEGCTRKTEESIEAKELREFSEDQRAIVAGNFEKAKMRAKMVRENPVPIDKKDQGKLQYSLIEPTFLRDLAKVLTMGAEKYSADGYKTVPDGKKRYTDALLRHVVDAMLGIKVDAESGLSPWSHVAANCMILMWIDGREEK